MLALRKLRVEEVDDEDVAIFVARVLWRGVLLCCGGEQSISFVVRCPTDPSLPPSALHSARTPVSCSNVVSITTALPSSHPRFSSATRIQQPSFGTCNPKCRVKMKLRASECGCTPVPAACRANMTQRTAKGMSRAARICNEHVCLHV